MAALWARPRTPHTRRIATLGAAAPTPSSAPGRERVPSKAEGTMSSRMDQNPYPAGVAGVTGTGGTGRLGLPPLRAMARSSVPR